MNQLMCRACGEFVPATRDGETLAPISDTCPECDGTEFKDLDSGDTIQTDATVLDEK